MSARYKQIYRLSIEKIEFSENSCMSANNPLIYYLSMESFGQLLSKKRIERGLSQAELARRSGVSQPLISMYESAKPGEKRPIIRPTIDNVIALAKALHCTLEDLTGISVNKEDTPELGGMIAVNPSNPEDRWYVAKQFFEDNYVPA